MTAVKKLKSKDASTEVKCSACDGTGFQAVAQPAQPGRKIYPARCKRCLGKGRIKSA
jgi:DnaJ-class molecular chaperone